MIRIRYRIMLQTSKLCGVAINGATESAIENGSRHVREDKNDVD